MKPKAAHGHNTATLKLKKNHCFGCGADNPDGMRLKFYFDDAASRTTCHFRLPRRYQGPPGHAHGGIIATILDEAMGKVNKQRSVVALTKTMNIEYMRPVPLGKRLKAVGWEKSVSGRKHRNVAEIMDDSGQVLARCEGLFIAVDVDAMFGKHVGKGKYR